MSNSWLITSGSRVSGCWGGRAAARTAACARFLGDRLWGCAIVSGPAPPEANIGLEAPSAESHLPTAHSSRPAVGGHLRCGHATGAAPSPRSPRVHAAHVAPVRRRGDRPRRGERGPARHDREAALTDRRPRRRPRRAARRPSVGIRAPRHRDPGACVARRRRPQCAVRQRRIQGARSRGPPSARSPARVAGSLSRASTKSSTGSHRDRVRSGRRRHRATRAFPAARR